MSLTQTGSSSMLELLETIGNSENNNYKKKEANILLLGNRLTRLKVSLPNRNITK